MRFLLTTLLLLSVTFSFGQRAFVEKKTESGGTSIGIVIEDSGKLHRYAPNCGFKPVCLLPDSTKIILIGELLSFAMDTSLYHSPVNRAANHYMGKKWPNATRYNTQISVLFFINYIAFSSQAFSYSPFPVLFDRTRGVELTFACDALDDVITLYENWYKTIKHNGFINYGLPLWGGQYQWFGTIMANIPLKKYPKWDEYYDCRIIE
jgi:hypothetical protein